MDEAVRLFRIAHNPHSLQRDKEEALSRLSALERSPQAGPIGRDILAHEKQDEAVLWFAASLLQSFIRRYIPEVCNHVTLPLILAQSSSEQVGPGECEEFKQFILSRLLPGAEGHPLPPSVNTALIKSIALIVVVQPKAFPDVFSFTFRLIQHSDLYTRLTGLSLLRVVCAELSSPELLPHQQKAELKDMVRSQLPSIFNSLRSVLQRCASSHSNEEAALVFGILLDIVGWCAVTSLSTPETLNLVFQYIRMHDSPLSIKAFALLNEVIAKKYIPREFEEFLLLVFREMCVLLQAVTESPSNFCRLSTEYVNQFTYFASLLVDHHIHRIQSSSRFDMNSFLELLMRYTHMQPTVDQFLQCMEIWDSLLDHLLEGSLEQRKDVPRYQEICLSHLSRMLNLMQFSRNESMLRHLESTCEYDEFIQGILVPFSKIVSLFPKQTVPALYQLLTERCDQLEVSANDREGLRDANKKALVKDTTILLQAFPSLLSIVRESSEGPVLVQVIVKIALLALPGESYHPNTAVDDLEAISIMVLRSFSSFLSTSKNSQELLRGCFQAISRLAQPDVNLRLAKSALDLLSSLSHVLDLLQNSDAVRVLEGLVNRMATYPTLALPTLCSTLCKAAVTVPKKLGNDPQPQWESRQHLLAVVLQPFHKIVHEVLESGSAASRNREMDVKRLTHSLDVFTHCVSILHGASAVGRKHFYAAMRPFLEIGMGLLGFCANSPSILSALLELYLGIFSEMKREMETSLLDSCLGTFFSCLNGHHLSNILREGSGESATKVVHIMVQLLVKIMEDPTSRFNKYVEGVVTLCTKQLYPVAKQVGAMDIVLAIFVLAYELCRSHWSVVGAGPMLDDILDMYLQQFREQDIEIYRNNLQDLGSLQQHQGLYAHQQFKRHDFITTFLHILVAGTHDNLRDFIVAETYRMSSVDFEAFFSRILPEWLSLQRRISANDALRLRESFGTPTSTHEFTSNLRRLINDAKYLSNKNS